MTSFTDRDGQEWSLAITVGHLPALQQLGFDPGLAVRDSEAFAAVFATEPKDLVARLHVLCAEQLEAAGMTSEQWAYRFDGPTVERATVALAEAVLDFFPRVEIARALRGNLHSIMTTVNRETAKQIEEAMTSTSNGSAGSSPALSVSIPDPSVTASSSA